MREVRLPWLRPAEIVAERERVSIVYLPIGPLEWHGPHLPIGTDPLQAEHTALKLAQRVGGVVHPTLFFGTERERAPELLRDLGFNGDEWIVGMDFPANSVRSYYYTEDAFALLVRLTLEQLAAQQYALIVIVNGHGATNQIDQLQRLAAEFSHRGPAKIIYTFDLDAEVDDDAGHATITETAAMLALQADRVDLIGCHPPIGLCATSTTPSSMRATFGGQPTPDRTVRASADPRRATRELGQHHFQVTVDRLAADILAEWHKLP